jgi:hypothetical protein
VTTGAVGPRGTRARWASMAGCDSEPVEVAKVARAGLIDAIRRTGDLWSAPPLSRNSAIEARRADFILCLIDDAGGCPPARAIPLDRSAG